VTVTVNDHRDSCIDELALLLVFKQNNSAFASKIAHTRTRNDYLWLVKQKSPERDITLLAEQGIMKAMSRRQTAIPCAILRGGTSRGVYFHRDDLPDDPALRDRQILAVMGGPDVLQIDGIGGGHPLNNKIAIVNQSPREDADVDYLFLQAVPQEARLSDGQNCGNILAGVGPYAIESGLVEAGPTHTQVRVHMVNSGNLCELTIETPDGIVNYAGVTAIDGVPGTAAPIICDFLDVAGSACGEMMPTGNVVDRVGGVEMTCIDNGMPVVVLRAGDFGISGKESPEELDANIELKSMLEKIRLEIGPLMNLGDVNNKTVPKMCLIAAPNVSGNVSTRTFIPHVCHRSIGVLGAVSVATACLLPGSVADGIANIPDGHEKTMIIEHPTGSFTVRLVVNEEGRTVNVEKAGVIRTARLLFRGDVFIPSTETR
jgi:4-oxalomesaconate tautomerase